MHPGSPSPFQRAISISALGSAFLQELSRDGPAGCDRQTAADFARDRETNLRQLHQELASGSYRCQPVVRLFAPKKSGGQRALGICTLRDRIVQRALLGVLSPLYERRFLDCSHGFRPRRSTHTALRQIQKLRQAGMNWAYEADIEDCFGSVQPDLLGAEIDAVCQDARMRRIVLKILRSGALESGVVYRDDLGLPQGAPISPLLSNIYLHPFDQALTEAGYHLIRYADDFMVLAASEAQAEAAGDAAEHALQQRLLRPSPDKTRVVSLHEGVAFLGFVLDRHGLRPHPKAIRGLQQRLREVHATHTEQGAEKRLGTLRDVLRGWRNYFSSFGDFQPEHPETALAAAEVALAVGDTDALPGFLYLADAAQLPHLSGVWKSVMARARQLQRWKEPGTQGASITTQERATSMLPSIVQGSTQRRSMSEEISPLAAEISLYRHRLHQNSADTHARHALADAYLRSNQHILAHSVLQSAGYANEHVPRIVTWEPDGPPLHLSQHAQERYIRLFRGKEGVMARAVARRDGRIQFQTCHVHWQPALLAQHLCGHAICALYPITEQEECLVMGVEVSPTRRVWQRHLHESDVLRAYARLAHDWSLQISRQWVQAGLSVLFEHPGEYGRRLWMFLEQPLSYKQAQACLRSLLRAGPALPEGLATVCFPEPNNAPCPAPGRPLSLPLGAHPTTGLRSIFLDTQNGEPIEPERALLDASQLTPQILRERWQRHERLQGEADIARRFPTVAQLLNHCLVMRRLVEKLQATRYLEHTERVSLLYTVGHLGDEGMAFLHAALSLCDGYDAQKTTRWVEKRRPFPISCPRLREKHPELLGGANCQCVFRRIPRHGYPTPLLHILPAKTLFDPKKLKSPKQKGK